MIRQGRWKLTYYHGLPPQLFDMEADPDEMRDLADSPEHGAIRDALIARVLDGWDPEAIARRMAEKEPETRMRREWALKTRPPEPHRYPHLHASDNRLSPD
jgi:arylsulfatase A-like enzyme